MRIIIGYASAGSGHRHAAVALQQFFKKNRPELDIALVDILEYTNVLFANLYSHGYSFLVSHLRFIWAIVYHLTRLKYCSQLFNFLCRLNCYRFINLLIQEQPDVFLATHFLPAAITAHLKHEGKIDPHLITIITDFGLHPLWVLKNCDDYIVGLDYTRDLLVGRGISHNKIKVLGIPVDSGFSARYKKDNLRNRFVALLVTGSFGFSIIQKVVDMLYSEINLLVVCGNNHRLYKRLERKHYKGVSLFGFTDQMAELMSQVDLIITKPGALTIAEALDSKLPLVFISSIPGQERENAQILESCGCAIYAKNLTSLKNIVINLKTHPERLNLLQSNIRKFRKPNSTENICRYIIK